MIMNTWDKGGISLLILEESGQTSFVVVDALAVCATDKQNR